MPRPVSTILAALLPLSIVHSTVEITMRSGAKKYLASDYLTVNNQFYDGIAARVGELTETLGAATNGVGIAIENVDYNFGILAASGDRPLELADVVIRRFYEDPQDATKKEHKFIFTGKLAKASASEKSVSLDVIPDTTAAGVCIAVETLSPANGWVSPEVQVSELPSGGGGVGSGDTQGTSGGGGGSFGGGFGGGGSCFAPGTLVATPSGLVAIENIKTKDAVLSFNPATFLIATDTVFAVMRHRVEGYLELRFSDGEMVRVTPEHPFLIAKNTFQAAGSLSVGDGIFKKKKDKLCAARIEKIVWVAKNTYVYNFHVAKNNTYFASGCAVHNLKSPYDNTVSPSAY